MKNFKLKKNHFFLFHLFFECYYCFIDLKRQPEHSGLRPHTSSHVVFILNFRFKFPIFSFFFKRLFHMSNSCDKLNWVSHMRAVVPNLASGKSQNLKYLAEWRIFISLHLRLQHITRFFPLTIVAHRTLLS